MEDGYDTVSSEDVPRVDLSEALDGMFEPDVQRVQSELDLDEMVVNIWHFEEGESLMHHRHDEQEEFYYVLDGEFEIKFGEPGDTDLRRVGTGDMFAASPEVGRGYRCVSEGGGSVLAVGAPNVTDINPGSYTGYDEA